MPNIKPYWVYPRGEEWVMIAFAQTAKEAVKIGFNNSPVSDDDAPFIEWRARRADNKWMNMYKGQQIITSCPVPYETFEDWYHGELMEAIK